MPNFKSVVDWLKPLPLPETWSKKPARNRVKNSGLLLLLDNDNLSVGL